MLPAYPETSNYESARNVTAAKWRIDALTCVDSETFAAESSAGASICGVDVEELPLL